MSNEPHVTGPLISLGQHPVDTTQKSFDGLGLSAPILKSIQGLGFNNPTPIQAAVIKAALEKRDILGLAQTGSGKTAAFCLPMAERLRHGEGIRGLILCPTREIALQTKAFLDIFGQHHHLTNAAIIGGVKMGPQIRALKKKPDIIVATPGRLYDHLERGLVSLQQLEILVLDEADHMFDLGFFPQIKKIMKKLPPKRQTLMFSATMPDSISNLASQFLDNPLRVDVLPSTRAAEGIQHRLYLVAPENKQDCLVALLHQELGSTLVFTRRKIDADWLYKRLKDDEHPVARIHSDRTQDQRTQALKGFREGAHRILVATDIASRGIDVPGIQQVVNFDIPQTEEEYIHRSGRTARAGAQGLASTIATWQDLPMIKKIERAIKIELPRCVVPGVTPFKEIKSNQQQKRRRRGW